MSSACVCHLEGDFCFYCEIYSPLERKREIQTGEIQRVIAELETEHKRNFEAEKRCELIEDKYYRQGGQDGLTFAIDKLKEVLASETVEVWSDKNNT